jgi:predicted NAD/FAD-binding protein
LEPRPKRVAIVGSGVAGLVCARALQRRHDIEVFEAAGWIGGHVHTVPVELAGRRFDVDTGFIVFHERTDPGFCRLLEELGVVSRPTEMSFSVRSDEAGLEYAGGSFSQLFADRRNLARPRFLRMVRDVLRFYRDARRLLEWPDPKVSLGAWPRQATAAADRGPPPAQARRSGPALPAVLEFPAPASRFSPTWLLSLRDRPAWRVVEEAPRATSRRSSLRSRPHPAELCGALAAAGAGGVELALADGSRRASTRWCWLHADRPRAPRRSVAGGAPALIRYQRNDVCPYRRAAPAPPPRLGELELPRAAGQPRRRCRHLSQTASSASTLRPSSASP